MQPPESALAAARLAPHQEQPAQVVAFTTGSFAPAPHELDEWKKLTDAERERINMLLSCFALMSSGNVRSQAQVLALRLSHLSGYSADNLIALYYKYRSSGWRSLRRGYKGPQELPDAFRHWFQAQCLKNSRSIRAQIDVVRRLWEAGESIPGYGTWQEWFLSTMPDRDLPRSCPGYPKGWSQSNLYTLQPPRAERALATRGYAAAKKHLLSIERDPSKLRPLELITIDDFEIDQLCVYHDPVAGKREICRVSGLLAMDVATRRKLSLGLKPRIQNEETGRMENIQRREVRYMIYCLIAEWGLPVDYPITILCENASAAIEKEFEDALKGLFGGRIRVTRTGIINCRTIENGFVQGGGKPWQKGWIESAFNAMHNIAAVLPGQKGANYTKKPAELAAQILYAERLLSVGPQGLNLTDEQVAQLRMPFRCREDMIAAYEIIFRLLDSRTNHKLLGFDRVAEYRLDTSSNWQPLEQLALVPADQQLGLEVRERPESPLERWDKLAARPECRRVKIDESVLASVLLTPKRAKFRNGRVTFTHGGKGYTFADTDCYLLNDREGEEVTCFFDEGNPTCVHVYNTKGAHIKTIKRLGPADITDPASMSATAAIVRTLENQTFAAVREKTLDQARELAGMVAHNEGVAPGVHLDASIRRSLGIKVEDAKAIVPPSVTKTLAAARKAGPIARDAFAGAASVSNAVVQAEQARADQARVARQTTRAVDNAADELSQDDIAAAMARPESSGEAPTEFSAEEIANLLRDGPQNPEQ